WGIAVVEAAAAGRPVVMTDVGCAGEVIRDGETGIVVPVGDVPALAKALVKLLRDSVLARTLGSAASVAAKLLQTPFATVEATRYSFEHAIDVRPIDFCQSNEHYCHPSEGWDPSDNRMDSCLRRNDNGELIYAKANSLLVVTQTVDLDDPVLGFFHRWLELLAEKTERLTIICLREGRHTLPKNVLVLSLGKETGPSRLKYVRLFYSYIFRYRRAYDGVLVHMNTEYAVLGGLFWRLMRKRVLLWYVHKSVTRKLRLAVELVHGVLTASKESFRLSSPKVRIIGHGVDTEIFTPTDVQVAPLQELRLLTVGRISESKDVRTLINAVEILRSNGGVVTLDIAGDSATDADKVYLQGLRDFVDNQNLQESVHFLGPVNYSALPALYRSHTIFVHASRTGSVDKTVLEALACGLPVVTSSEAFVEGFAPYVKRFPQGDAEALAETIKLLLNAETVLPNTQAVHFIRERYDLKCLISVIIDSYEKDVLSSQR
ncbi:MAG: glycosyltransferase, partial [Patescibacteria group bacterium]